MINVAAIILAAGYSSRMGSLKALLPMGAKTVIERLVNTMHDAGIKDVYVVTGYRGNEIRNHLLRSDVIFVDNPVFKDGMFSSVLAGLRAIYGKPYDAFVITPVDYPLLGEDIVREIIDAYYSGDYSAAYPVFNGQKGHPPVISARCIPAILSYAGKNGLRDVLAQFDSSALRLNLPDISIITDIDTPEDYSRVLSLWKSRMIPQHLFIQGEIGIGKSTLIQEVITPYRDEVEGFYVRRHMCSDGACVAFSLQCIKESPFILREEIHSEEQGLFRICKAGDDCDNNIFLARIDAGWRFLPEVFETLGKEILQQAINRNPSLIILDEIGGLESACPLFMQTMKRVLSGGTPCLGVFKYEKNARLQKEFLCENNDYDMARSELVSAILRDGGRIVNMSADNKERVRRTMLAFVSRAMGGLDVSLES